MKTPKFGYWLPGPIREPGPLDAVEQGIVAEKCGFDSVWLGDHFSMYAGQLSETFTALAVIGVKTDRVMVSSNVVDPLKRHPAIIAQIVASIDRLTNGRAALGIGAGELLNLKPFGIAVTKPLTRVREAVEVIRRLWASTPEDPANYEGEFYRLENAYLYLKPCQRPHPRIYLGALGRNFRILTGAIGDGYLPWVSTPESYKTFITDLAEGASKAGRSLNNIDKAAMCYISISNNRQEAVRSVEKPAKMALILEGSVLRFHGYERIDRSTDLSIQRTVFTKEKVTILEQEASKVPINFVEDSCAIGSPADCIEKLEEFLKAGADHLILANVSPNFKDSMEALSRDIIPHFKSKQR